MDTIIVGCLIIGLFIIMISHELGHFLTALKFGIRGKEIGIGFRIPGIQTLSISKEIRGVKFSLNPILIGAFASISNKEVREIGDLRGIAVLSAGSLVNIFSGILVIIIIKKSVIGGIELIVSAICTFWMVIAEKGELIDMLISITTETSSLMVGIIIVSMLSIFNGILNLMPLPILDGGRIFSIISERIFGKEKSELLYMAMLAVVIIVLWSF